MITARVITCDPAWPVPCSTRAGLSGIDAALMDLSTRIGALTLANPAATTRCAVAVQYLYKPAGGRQTSKTLTVIVPPAARVSRSVNSDLDYPAYRARTASVSLV